MNRFSRTMSGRAILSSLALALGFGGLSTLANHTVSPLLLFIALFGAVCIDLVALGFALEDHWAEAVLSIVLLPLALFLFAVGVGVVANFYPQGGYGFIALAAVPLALA